VQLLQLLPIIFLSAGQHVHVVVMKRARPDPVPSNKDIALFYFTTKLDHDTYECRCGTTRKGKPQTGWSNLMTHVTMSHPNYLTEYNSSLKAGAIHKFFYTEKTKSIHGWLEWLLTCNLPFDTVEKEMFKKYSVLRPISYKTLMKYMESLTKVVEKKISACLPVSNSFIPLIKQILAFLTQ
jgi:hypothetical protein